MDSRAYAPSARVRLQPQSSSSSGVPMPLNLAVLRRAVQPRPIAAHPEVAVWAVGGHSLGGAMAAAFAWQPSGRGGGSGAVGGVPGLRQRPVGPG